MEFHRSARHRPIINMINMVDVMLLLLIFFAASTTFIQRPAIVVEPPESEHLTLLRTGVILVSIGAAGELYIDAENVEASELRSRLSERLQQEKDKHVVVEADRRVPYGTVVQTVDEVLASGAQRISLPAVMKHSEPSR